MRASEYLPIFIDQFSMLRRMSDEELATSMRVMMDYWDERPVQMPDNGLLCGVIESFISRLEDMKLYVKQLREKRGEAARKAAEARWNATTSDSHEDVCVTHSRECDSHEKNANKIKEIKEIKDNRERDRETSSPSPSTEDGEVVVSEVEDPAEVQLASSERQEDTMAKRWIASFVQRAGLQKSVSITEPRMRSVRRAFKEYGEDGMEKILLTISQSSFLHGNNERGWVAKFDWCIKPANLVKIHEGNYDDNRQRNGRGGNTTITAEYDEQLLADMRAVIRGGGTN